MDSIDRKQKIKHYPITMSFHMSNRMATDLRLIGRREGFDDSEIMREALQKWIDENLVEKTTQE